MKLRTDYWFPMLHVKRVKLWTTMRWCVAMLVLGYFVGVWHMWDYHFRHPRIEAVDSNDVPKR